MLRLLIGGQFSMYDLFFFVRSRYSSLIGFLPCCVHHVFRRFIQQVL